MELDYKKKLLGKVIGKISERERIIGDSVHYKREAAVTAPSRNESRYDSTKAEHSMMAELLETGREEVKDGLAKLLDLDLQMDCFNIGIGSIVELVNESNGSSESYFLLPYGGGEEVTFADKTIQVVTPSSPMFIALKNRKSGEDFELKRGDKSTPYFIVNSS